SALIVADGALDVQGGPGAHARQLTRVAAAVDRGVDVHVTGEVVEQFGALAGEEVDDAAGEVAGGEHFGERDGGEGFARRRQRDARVAADDGGHDRRDQSDQAVLFRGKDGDD